MNILTKYLPRTLMYGKCIGVSKNSKVSVYKKTSYFGDNMLLTSFTPDNKILKQISIKKEQQTFKLNKIKDFITTIAKNFKDNTITIIKKEKIYTANQGKLPFGQQYDKMIKTQGSMDKNQNLDVNKKRTTISLIKKKLSKAKHKITTYPNGAKICQAEIKDQRRIHKYIYAQDVQMPGGQVVNRFITKDSQITPFGEETSTYNGKPGNDICNITDKQRSNF